MTLRQTVLNKLYPLLMRFSSLRGSGVYRNEQQAAPATPFYGLSFLDNSGKPFPMQQLQGKKVLLVNTASDCGFTAQYAELQQLYTQQEDQLVIIGFPANDFKDQENGSDASIAQFCKRIFDVHFPLAQKSKVVPGPGQHPVYGWLTQSGQNGWNNKPPSWNFSKYLVNDKGVLTHYFEPWVSPLGPQVKEALTQA